MSLRALVIPVSGEPEVMRDRSWAPAAVAHVLGDDPRAFPANWVLPSGHRMLVIAGKDSSDYPNPYARAMAGIIIPPLCGPLIVLAIDDAQRIADIGREELLVIAVRLLVAEATPIS